VTRQIASFSFYLCTTIAYLCYTVTDYLAQAHIILRI
jgi:hypothetical protein